MRFMILNIQSNSSYL